MIFVLPFLSLLIASPVDFLSRIYLQVTFLYTQLWPKRRPPFTWGAATASLWSPEAILAPLSAVSVGLSSQNALAQTKIGSSYSLKCSDVSPAHSRWNRNSVIWHINSVIIPQSYDCAPYHSWIHLLEFPFLPPTLGCLLADSSRFKGFSSHFTSLHKLLFLGSRLLIRISFLPLYHLLQKLYPLSCICI